MSNLINGREIDRLFGWPAGKAEKLAKRGKLPHYLLPDGSVRFCRDEILALIRIQSINGKQSTQPESEGV
jgi:hypothetical protein